MSIPYILFTFEQRFFRILIFALIINKNTGLKKEKISLKNIGERIQEFFVTYAVHIRVTRREGINDIFIKERVSVSFHYSFNKVKK